jgi:hypothetical protein
MYKRVATYAPDRHRDALPQQRATLSSQSAPEMQAAPERPGPPAYTAWLTKSLSSVRARAPRRRKDSTDIGTKGRAEDTCQYARRSLKYIFTERDGRKGPPAGNKARCIRTNTRHSKAMQRKAKPNQTPQTHTRGARQAAHSKYRYREGRGTRLTAWAGEGKEVKAKRKRTRATRNTPTPDRA